MRTFPCILFAGITLLILNENIYAQIFPLLPRRTVVAQPVAVVRQPGLIGRISANRQQRAQGVQLATIRTGNVQLLRTARLNTFNVSSNLVAANIRVRAPLQITAAPLYAPAQVQLLRQSYVQQVQQQYVQPAQLIQQQYVQPAQLIQRHYVQAAPLIQQHYVQAAPVIQQACAAPAQFLPPAAVIQQPPEQLQVPPQRLEQAPTCNCPPAQLQAAPVQYLQAPSVIVQPQYLIRSRPLFLQSGCN